MHQTHLGRGGAPRLTTPGSVEQDGARRKQRPKKKVRKPNVAFARKHKRAAQPGCSHAEVVPDVDEEALDQLAIRAAAAEAKLGAVRSGANPLRPGLTEGEDLGQLGSFWFAQEGRPPHAEVKKQLQLLRARNRPGNAKTARAKMDRGLVRARREAAKLAKNSTTRAPSGAWRHLVGDGEGSAAWRHRLRLGERPPPPFGTHGSVGEREDFSLSAVREALLQAQKTPVPPLTAPQRTVETTGGVSLPRVRVAAESYVEALRPPGAEGEALPEFLCRLADGALDQGEDFWRCVASSSVDEQSSNTVAVLVAEAKQRASFKPLRNGRHKTDAIWLFELCNVPERRADAIAAMAWLGSSARRTEANLTSALLQSQKHLHAVQLVADHAEWMDGAEGPAPLEAGKAEQLEKAFSTLSPPAHVPPVTEAGPPDPHPWLGYLDEVSFGELAAGAGHFAAHFVAAGAKCAYVMEPRREVQRRAVLNAGGAAKALDSVMAMDPVDLPWTHMLVGGAE